MEDKDSMKYGMTKEDAMRKLEKRKKKIEDQDNPWQDGERMVQACENRIYLEKVNREAQERVDAVQQTKLKNDSWASRSENMQCWSCMYYVHKKGSIGRCRRHAPTVPGFPVVMCVDFCGDWKLNEKL